MLLSEIGYPHFELVVYTVENAMTFYPIVDGLDPNQQYIMYRLFRDATRYVNGQHTKDLSALNRDPRKVILVDWNEKAVALNRENTLLMKKWEGDNSDRTLIGLTQFLQGKNELIWIFTNLLVVTKSCELLTKWKYLHSSYIM